MIRDVAHKGTKNCSGTALEVFRSIEDSLRLKTLNTKTLLAKYFFVPLWENKKGLPMQMPSSIATRLQYQHKSLIELIDGLTDEQVRRHIIPGKWSIYENIVHLQTYQHVFIKRIKQILEENNPAFHRYTAEGDPMFLENCGKTSREVMHDMLMTRKEMTIGIFSLADSDIHKTAVHPVYGKMGLLLWLNFFLLHEAHHLFTIFKLAAQLKVEGEEKE